MVEGLHVGYRWYDATEREVAFPFGFGLGYTTFRYDSLTVSVPDADTARATVQVTVSNSGDRAGSDVIQVYVADTHASVARPKRELRAFSKVWLEPGETRVVTLDLDERAFAYWGRGGWTVEPGEFTIHAGPNSRDLPLQEVLAFTMDAPAFELDDASTLLEWASHPVGLQVLQGAMVSMGQPGDALTNDDSLPLFGTMPLRTILGFAQQSAGATLDVEAVLMQLLDAVKEG
ncbi:fibronectin type III-like domain-contianing protein [Microbacterium gorillae]|uniref:fibronectin type III-like domain-contianing protein n=1 Tax=Microbacterium gorillae TaxID=1231063 RepID=UPI003D99DA80